MKRKDERISSNAQIYTFLSPFVRRNQRLQERIDATLSQMQLDIFAPELGTHKLSGNLYGLLACSCGYDCRIVFTIEQTAQQENEVIVLLDIGTHDEIY